MKGYGPADPQQSPRFAGISTFLRLPHVTDLDGVDVAFVGLPFDTGVSFRAGARFGPKAIREGSLTLRPLLQPGAAGRRVRAPLGDRLRRRARRAGLHRPLLRQDGRDAARRCTTPAWCPSAFGGDHSVLLPELRAAAERHGPLALVSSTPTPTPVTSTSARSTRTARWCAAPSRRASSTPARSTLMGMRGGLYGPDELDDDRELGLHRLPWDDLAQLGTGAVAAAVERAARQGLPHLRHRLRRPGVRARARARPSAAAPRRCRRWRCCAPAAACDIVGADVVEVLPDLDTLAPHGHARGHGGLGDPQPHRLPDAGDGAGRRRR